MNRLVEIADNGLKSKKAVVENSVHYKLIYMRNNTVIYLELLKPSYYGLCGSKKVYLAVKKSFGSYQICNISKAGDFISFDVTGCADMLNMCKIVSADAALAKNRLKEAIS